MITSDDIQQRSFHIDRSGSGATIPDKEINHFLNNSKKIIEAKEDYFKHRLEQNIYNLNILHKKQRYIKKQREQLWLKEKYLKQQQADRLHDIHKKNKYADPDTYTNEHREIHREEANNEYLC